MTKGKKLKKMIQEGEVKFAHFFNPKANFSKSKHKTPTTEERWVSILEESYAHRLPHHHHASGFFYTEPLVITVATLENGDKGYAWCSTAEKHWDRKKGNRIALIRALKHPVRHKNK